MNIIESLNWRYATKEFDPTRKISKEDLDVISESLRLTASSFGLQPWKFLIISNEKIKKSLFEHSWNQRQVVDCSHHIVFCCPRKFDDDNVDAFLDDTAQTRDQSLEDLEGYGQMMKGFLSKMDDDKKQIWMKNQLYIALGNLLTTCALIKIDACPMEGMVQAKYDEILGLKEKGLMTAFACPVGYRTDSDKYSSAPKVRFSISEVIDYLD
jgi:nitroreductase / dihydropteridine reductase